MGIKKYIALVLAIWLLLIVGSILLWHNNNYQSPGKTYKVDINRINHGISKLLTEDEMDKVKAYMLEQTVAYNSVTSISIMSKTDKRFESFLSGIDLKSERLNFLPIVDSSYVVRYEINEEIFFLNNLYIYNIVVITLLSIFLLVTLIVVYVNVLRPSKRITKLPYQLAKGHLNYQVEQDNYGYFSEFLWGIDMLREVLREEKEKNLILEKQRKTLVASLSHDIKTPLSSIQNYSRAILDDIYVEVEDRKKALKIILNKSLVIEKLTKELLDSSKNHLSNVTVKLNGCYTHDLIFEINYLIHQKVDLLKIEYRKTTTPHNWLLSIDFDKMIEVIDNVIENAIKYGDGKWIELKTREEDGFLLIVIENSGEPVSNKELKYIFTSFYRGSNTNDKQGHGLGLYIAKKLMKAMGGDIYAHNTDQGFSVSIVARII